MNVQEAARVLLYLTEAYPNYHVTEASTQVWADEFCGDSFEHVSAAAKTHARQSTFAPTFAEIHAILDSDDALSSLTADQIWSSIRQQIGNVGTNGRPQLTEVEREVVSGFGGWRVMCQSQLEDIYKRLPRIVEHAKAEVRKKRRLDELDGGTIRKIGA